MSSPNSEPSDPKTLTTPSVSSKEGPARVDPEPGQPDGESSNSAKEEKGKGGEEGEEEEEEEGECGFCLFMKGGGCKTSFVAWETCVEEAEKKGEDIAKECMKATSALHKCMEAHSDYYDPLLRAEKSAREEAAKELEKEKAAKDSDSQQNLESKDELKKN